MMIYVHIPFCRQKCIYCAFYSVPSVNACKSSEYVETLCKEIAFRKNELPNEKVKTLYFGGGTPSLLQGADLQKIIEVLNKNYDLSELQEFTFEANPEQLTKPYLEALKRLGVNRLSVGVQSFNDEDLRFLNRRHTSQQALEAVKTAQNVGFSNISIDLIYGLPNSKTWKQNLKCVETLDIQHLSCYSLTLEEGTILDKLVKKGKVSLPTDDEVLEQYDFLLQWSKNQGFRQYEISNFCKEGRRSQHNSGYWNGTHYLGFGAAAHSFDGTQRRWNFGNLDQYQKSLNEGVQCFDCEVLTKEMRFNEYLMTALRTTEGLKNEILENEFFDFLPNLKIKMQKFVDQGLIEITSDGFRPTVKGLLLADGIASDLFE